MPRLRRAARAARAAAGWLQRLPARRRARRAPRSCWSSASPAASGCRDHRRLRGRHASTGVGRHRRAWPAARPGSCPTTTARHAARDGHAAAGRATTSTRSGSSAATRSSPVRCSGRTRDGDGVARSPRRSRAPTRCSSRASARRQRRAPERAAPVVPRRALDPDTARISVVARADLLPPPGPRDRGLLLELRTPDLSRLHDAVAGRHALPGVRAARRPRSVERRLNRRRRRVLTYILIGDLRGARVRRPVERRQRGRRRHGHAGRRPRPVTASTSSRASTSGCSRRASCTPASRTCSSTCSSLYILGSLLEPAIGRLRFAIIYFVSLFAGSFGALLLAARRRRRSAPRARSSA